MFRSLRTLALLSSLILATAETALASDAPDLDAARQLFDAGSQLQDQHDYEAAATNYRKALAIKETPGLRYRLGYCEAMLGHLLEARVQYERAQTLLDAGVVAPDVAELLPGALADLQARTPQISLVVTGAGGGLELYLDGTRLPTEHLAQAIPLDPGSHRIELRQLGHRPFVTTAVLVEGETRRIEAKLTPLAASPASPPPANGAGGPSAAKTAVVVVEAALALAGLSVGLLYAHEQQSAEERVLSAHEEIDELENAESVNCEHPEPEALGPCQRLFAALSDYDRARQIAGAGFITAGVATTAGIATYLLWPNTRAPEVGLLLGPATRGVTLRGRF